jgi:hypothetical protein
MVEAWRRVADGFELLVTMEQFLLDAHRSGKPVRLDELPNELPKTNLLDD